MDFETVKSPQSTVHSPRQAGYGFLWTVDRGLLTDYGIIKL